MEAIGYWIVRVAQGGSVSHERAGNVWERQVATLRNPKAETRNSKQGQRKAVFCCGRENAQRAQNSGTEFACIRKVDFFQANG